MLTINMDAANQDSVDFSYEYLDSHADAYVASVLEQIQADLESITQHITNNNETPLKNCWDEICAQMQGEKFDSWRFYEMTIEGVIESCFDALPHQDQLYINFAALKASSTIAEPEFDYESIDRDKIILFLYKEILQIAVNDNNPRVQAYLDPFSEVNEDSPHNLDEYLLLRIDPARRTDFLAVLNLFGFVKNVEIDEQAVPLFSELLDNLTLPNN